MGLGKPIDFKKQIAEYERRDRLKGVQRRFVNDIGKITTKEATPEYRRGYQIAFECTKGRHEFFDFMDHVTATKFRGCVCGEVEAYFDESPGCVNPAECSACVSSGVAPQPSGGGSTEPEVTSPKGSPDGGEQ